MSRRAVAVAALAASLAAPVAFTPAQAAIITPAASVTYGVAPALTITSTGPFVLDLAPGESFHVAGTFATANFLPGCDHCTVQGYLAGLRPVFTAQVNLFSGDLFLPISGSYSADLLAPETPGTYYLGAAFTLEPDYLNGVHGSATQGTLKVNYEIHVAALETPEPASLALLAGALAALAPLRRRRA